MDANDHLRALVEQLHSTDEPDVDLISAVGCGPLEDLISEAGEELWPEVERLARTDRLFRRALSSVWAYDSPEFEQRNQLLRELGEWWPVSVRFVVEPQDLLSESRVSWRAVEIDGGVPAGQLSRLLREIADWYDREPNQAGRRYVDTMGNSWSIYYEWCQTVWALERAWHRVGLADDAASFRTAKDEVDTARIRERESWQLFLHAMGYREAGAE